MVNDPVADALIRIKNGYMAHQVGVSMPYTKLVFNICQVLSKEGFINDCKKDGQIIKVNLKYNGHSPAISDVKRISKPGLRVYKGARILPRVLNGFGIAIISTPKGLMTDKKAREEGVGGEVMAFVW